MQKKMHYRLKRKKSFQVNYPKQLSAKDIISIDNNEPTILKVEVTRHHFEEPAAVKRIMDRNLFDIVSIKTKGWKEKSSKGKTIRPNKTIK